MRDAYRQQWLHQIYDGDPPAAIIEQMQGINDDNFDPEKLLDEQHEYEKTHGTQAQPATPPASQPASGHAPDRHGNRGTR